MAVARPRIPGDGDLRACGHRDLRGAGEGRFVAGDVRGAKGGWRDEADVLVEGEPAGLLRLGGGVEPDLVTLMSDHSVEGTKGGQTGSLTAGYDTPLATMLDT